MCVSIAFSQLPGRAETDSRNRIRASVFRGSGFCATCPLSLLLLRLPRAPRPPAEFTVYRGSHGVSREANPPGCPSGLERQGTAAVFWAWERPESDFTAARKYRSHSVLSSEALGVLYKAILSAGRDNTCAFVSILERLSALPMKRLLSVSLLKFIFTLLCKI